MCFPKGRSVSHMILGGMECTRSTAMHVEQSGNVWFHIAKYQVVENTALCPSVYGRQEKLLTTCGFFMSILLLLKYVYQLV